MWPAPLADTAIVRHFLKGPKRRSRGVWAVFTCCALVGVGLHLTDVSHITSHVLHQHEMPAIPTWTMPPAFHRTTAGLPIPNDSIGLATNIGSLEETIIADGALPKNLGRTLFLESSPYVARNAASFMRWRSLQLLVAAILVATFRSVMAQFSNVLGSKASDAELSILPISQPAGAFDIKSTPDLGLTGVPAQTSIVTHSASKQRQQWPNMKEVIQPVHVKIVIIAECFAPMVFVNDDFQTPLSCGAVPISLPKSYYSPWFTLLGEVPTRKPSYLQLLPPARPEDAPRLWMTSFSISQDGGLVGIVPDQTQPFVRSNAPLLWPNDVTHVPAGAFAGVDGPILLVADGFLVPGKRDGGIWAISNAGSTNEAAACLTSKKDWFYHKAVPFTIAGHEGILTARASAPLVPFVKASGELVWLEKPNTLSPLSSWSTPWREHVLAKGPDVMFDVADLDPTDGTVEVFAAEFFSQRLTMHSIGWNAVRNCPAVLLSRVIDDNLGPAYGVKVASLVGQNSHVLVTSHKFSMDYEYSGQSHAGGWSYTTLPPPAASPSVEGGSCYAYEIPADWRASGGPLLGRKSREAMDFVARITDVFQRVDTRRAGRIGIAELQHCMWELGLPFSDVELATIFLDSPCITFSQYKTFMLQKQFGEADTRTTALRRFMGLSASFEIDAEDAKWPRTTIATGFKVKRLSINPGAPGFVYTFYPHKDMETQGLPPHLMLAGDCSDAAYIFRPVIDSGASANSLGGCLRYELMATIGVDGTVGSLAVGYTTTPGSPDDGWAKIFMPVYEKDRVYVLKCGPPNSPDLHG